MEIICLCLPSTRIQGVGHHGLLQKATVKVKRVAKSWTPYFFFFFNFSAFFRCFFWGGSSNSALENGWLIKTLLPLSSGVIYTFVPFSSSVPSVSQCFCLFCIFGWYLFLSRQHLSIFLRFPCLQHPAIPPHVLASRRVLTTPPFSPLSFLPGFPGWGWGSVSPAVPISLCTVATVSSSADTSQRLWWPVVLHTGSASS